MGWKAARAGPWAIQPQGRPCTPVFPRQAACGGEGGAEGTSCPNLKGWQAQGPGQRKHTWLWWKRLHMVLGRSWDRAERCGASLGCAAISAQVPGATSFQLYPKFCWGPAWDQSKMGVSEGAFVKGRNSSKN